MPSLLTCASLRRVCQVNGFHWMCKRDTRIACSQSVALFCSLRFATLHKGDNDDDDVAYYIRYRLPRQPCLSSNVTFVAQIFANSASCVV